jgi:excisionase family DNA binding protein
MKTWLTVTESAEYAGVSRDTIYAACERRELRHARVGGRRAIRVKRDWIDAWFERHARGTQHVAITAVTTPVASRVEHASLTAATSRSDGPS